MIYFQGTVCWRCVLAALRTIKLSVTKVGNQAKLPTYSEKKRDVLRNNLERMFKRTATDLDTQPTKTQQ